VVRTAGKPLHAKEIAERVIESGRCSGLKGKTPEATIAATLAVGSKPGGPFKRVDKAMYTLADEGHEGSRRADEARGQAASAAGREGRRGRPTGGLSEESFGVR
jgi:hypothetical protein